MSDEESLRAAVERSRIASAALAGLGTARSGKPVRDGIDGSRVVTGARTAAQRARKALDSSTVLHRVRDLSEALSRTVESASVVQVADSTATAVSHSWLYRWLTAEPEQEVIVIDLRETLTVAPFINAVDRSLQRVLPARAHSVVASTAAQASMMARTAPVRVASGLLLTAVLLSLLAAVVLGALSPLVLGVQVVGVVTGLAGLRVDASWTELRESRPARLVAAVLEPPPPPERED